MGAKWSKKEEAVGSEFDILKVFDSPEGRRSFLLVQNARPSCYKGIDVSKEWLLLDLNGSGLASREWIAMRRDEGDVWIGTVNANHVGSILDYMNQHGLWEKITLADSTGHAFSDEDYLGIGLSMMAYWSAAPKDADADEKMTMYYPHGESDVVYGEIKKNSAPDELKQTYQTLLTMIQSLALDHAVTLSKPLYHEYSSYIMPQKAFNWIQCNLLRQQQGN